MKYPLIIISCFLLLVFQSCENSKETLVTDSISDFMPMQTGKFITYRIDSTVFTQSGSKLEVHKYQVKHTVQTETTDNEGRKSFVVRRQLNNETGTGSWTENGNYIVTVLPNRIEVFENNLRYIPLQMPMKQGISWKGNSYMPSVPYKPLYDMGAGSAMNTWNFYYSNFADTTVQSQQYKDVWTVVHSENVLNIPATPDTYGEIEVSSEKYARNIGLVYKNFQLYEHQPKSVDFPQPYYAGFGITMWMIAHN